MDAEKRHSGQSQSHSDRGEGQTTELLAIDVDNLHQLGYEQDLTRCRSLATLLFQSIAIVAIPYAFGSPLITAIYGGGQLSMFLGWVVTLILSEAVAFSLGELASRYPTAAGPYYWTFQLAPHASRRFLSFVTGWTWLIGNWTITLSVNFGFASLIAGCVALYHPDSVVTAWQLLLIFYAMCLITFVIVAFGNRILPWIDTVCVAFTIVAVIAIMICLLVTAKFGRHSGAVTFGNYDNSLSGWNGFSFLIGMIPSAYVFAPIGMLTSMAEECAAPKVTVPRAMYLCIVCGGLVGLVFILPICATMPDLADILNAPVGQALPYIYGQVMGSPGGGLGLTFLVLVVSLFCSISITVATSRCTWAFARDHAIPMSSVWGRIDRRFGSPLMALTLTTVVQMLLGLISLGSSSAFLAFVSTSVIAIAVAYAVPLSISMLQRRAAVNAATWRMPNAVGWAVNTVAMVWVIFQIVLFSLPSVLPIDAASMNYAIVVYIGLFGLSTAWYFIHARKVYHGPPESAGL